MSERSVENQAAGMRYRLRTLLVLLTIGPLILALGWWEYGKYVERKRLREAQNAGKVRVLNLGLHERMQPPPPMVSPQPVPEQHK